METNDGDSTSGASIFGGDGVSGYEEGTSSVLETVEILQAVSKSRSMKKERTRFIDLLIKHQDWKAKPPNLSTF
jgi:hypothetical protein